MRDFGRRVRSIVTFPLRLVTAPYRKMDAFLNQEPEETPTAEVFSRTFEQPRLLVDHLEALRRHLLRAVVFLIITTALSFTFARQILAFLTSPVGGIQALQSIEVTESIGAFMRVSLLSGLVLALPYILFEVFLFLNPALRPAERKMVLVLLPVGTLLFVMGLAFAYFVMLPTALDFLVNFMGIPAQLRPANYIQFTTGVMFWIGVAFEFPLIVYVLAAIGMVRADMLWRGWRIAIVAIAILAAVITPTIDPVNMGLVMAPMTVLYFLSIGLAAIAQRGRA
jgi:sec-independent protein translocase protein TatC